MLQNTALLVRGLYGLCGVLELTHSPAQTSFKDLVVS